MDRIIIKKATLPAGSMLNTMWQRIDYVDSYLGILQNGISPNIEDVGLAFFNSEPSWIKSLFSLRNKIVKYFGLKITDEIFDRKKLLDNFTYDAGKKLGFFKVFAKSDHELILGEDDRHLDFRVSLYIRTDKVNHILTVSTIVKFNEWLGKYYFFFVKPFHQMIVQTMVRGIAKQLELNENL